jgi:hypothetical protein
LVSTTTRGSRVIKQAAQLAAGQALAPGFLTRFFAEPEQSVHVAAWAGVHKDANRGIRGDVSSVAHACGSSDALISLRITLAMAS